MNTGDFLGVADALTQVGGRFAEGNERTAISRYYYSAFLEARDRLAGTLNIRIKKYNAHEDVRRGYGFSQHLPLRHLGELLDQLRKLRVNADYDVASALDRVNIAEAKSMSEEIRAGLLAEDLKRCVNPYKL